MISATVEITNRLGLHARPAVLLVKTTALFDSEIKLIKEDIEVDGKSIMGILMLAAGQGTQLEVVCNGKDESDAINAIKKLFEDGFGEN